MIVKNESKTLPRCLESVKNILDYYVICDTGSTDDTKEIIQKILKNIPGIIYDIPWVNFGYNRTKALELAKGKTDYAILLDADNTLVINPDFNKEKLTADAYYLRQLGSLDYSQILLINNRLLFKYFGTTHEYIESHECKIEEELKELKIKDFEDGSNRKNKSLRDIELLKQGIIDEPNSSRYHFYLAQTYKDIGEYEKAIEYYLKRIEMKGWEEETYYSMYSLAYCEEQLGKIKEAKYHYLSAWEFRPTRAESLFRLAQLCRCRKEYQQGYMFAKKGLEITYPKDKLFINKNIYDYELLFEKSICSYWLGKYPEAYNECKKIMEMSGIPENIADQNKKNIQFSEQKIFGKIVTNTYDKKFVLMTESEKEQQAIEIKALEQLFKKEFDLQLYPIYGTLLGIVRDNDFIGYDYDIDLAYISKYRTKEEILVELNQICERLKTLELLEKRFSFNGQLHVFSPSKKAMVDIWTSWIENGNYYLTYTIDGEIKEDQIFPFKPIIFKNQELLIPNHPESILEFLYHSWKTPLKDNFAKAKWVFKLSEEK